MSPTATASFEMYTVELVPPADDDPPAADATEDKLDDGAVAYTSCCVAGYTVRRICTGEVSTWETTVAVVTVAGGAAMPPALQERAAAGMGYCR